VTTIVWITVTFLTRSERPVVLRKFYRLTHPGGPGWKKVIEEANRDQDPIDEADRGLAWEMPIQLLCVFTGLVVIYSSLFAIGSFVYERPLTGFGLLAVALGGTYVLFRSFSKLRAN